MERSLLTWIFSLSGFSAVSGIDTLRVGALLHARFLKVPRSALEGFTFDRFIVDFFGGGFKVV